MYILFILSSILTCCNYNDISNKSIYSQRSMLRTLPWRDEKKREKRERERREGGGGCGSGGENNNI